MTDEQDIHEFALPDIGRLSGSLAQRVYEALRIAILAMDLPPGTPLRKQVICEQLGVSRSPVTEAITKLAGEGLVEVIPQSGSRVTKFFHVRNPGGRLPAGGDRTGGGEQGGRGAHRGAARRTHPKSPPPGALPGGS
ncbi:GntR family transcriptional regulator [Roseibium salinum]|nr:GntR family transcriptional regulator [Roseibium salinum]